MLPPLIDPSQNFLEKLPHPLYPFFWPRSVAVVGAKGEAGSVGYTLVHNLQKKFKGKIYPVNPKRDQVLGLPCYPTLQAISAPVDLAIIAAPAKVIPDVIDDCARAKISSAVVISAGFKETGKAGKALEEELLLRAERAGIRIIGPNCLGIMNPHIALNATFAADIALPGNMAFISQSGALCTAVLDWSLQEKIGFSAFVSVGSMADIGWGDLIDYFAQDPETESILMYMETVGDARAFLSAARQAVFTKPVILIKPGRSEAAAKAAVSHTGSLAGADDVFDAAIERAGVLRVNTIAELFDMAAVLGKQPYPNGAHLAIVTNAGGPAVLATDALEMSGAHLAELSHQTMQALNQILPAAWSHANPVDVLGDADAKRYQQAIDVVLQDANVDGLLVILTPQDMTDSTGTAQVLTHLDKRNKPLLASWMGASYVEKGNEILNQAGIATFSYPDSAAAAFARLWKQADAIQLLYETPVLRDELSPHQAEQEKSVQALFKRVGKRVLLTEAESKQVLHAYGIATVQTIVVDNILEAVQAAEKIGYPVVLKLHSETITHKSDVGGVKLNLKHAEEVKQAFCAIQESVEKNCGPGHFAGVSVQKMAQLSGYSLILGSMTDPQFGPVIVFGSGGELVEVIQDRAIGLPPLNTTLAKRLIQKTKIYKALLGVRGRPPIDFNLLEQTMIRFSQLIAEQPRIKECDINPLIVDEAGLLALDARIVLHDFSIPDAQLPKAAIRSYPVEEIEEIVLKDGAKMLLRPLLPEDEPLVSRFHQELSAETVRSRYFGFMSLEKRIAHERLVRICHPDYAQEVTVAAIEHTSKSIVGICRLRKMYRTAAADLKMVIVDRCQGKGLGSKMLAKIVTIAAKEGISTISAHILSENHGMIALCKKMGFQFEQESAAPLILKGYLVIKPASDF